MSKAREINGLATSTLLFLGAPILDLKESGKRNWKGMERKEESAFGDGLGTPNPKKDSGKVFL